MQIIVAKILNKKELLTRLAEKQFFCKLLGVENLFLALSDKVKEQFIPNDELGWMKNL